jgi:hypothetical protein
MRPDGGLVTRRSAVVKASSWKDGKAAEYKCQDWPAHLSAHRQ